MTNLLLVHGAWHGSWAWDDTIEPLREAGMRPIAIDLPGSDGDPDVTLSDQVDALRAAISGHDRPVVVAHSHGGIVAQQALMHAVPPDACAFIGIDAWLGRDGQSFIELVPDWMREAFDTLLRAGKEVSAIPAPPPGWFGLDEATAITAAAQMRQQPLRTFTDPLRLSVPRVRIPSAGIVCEPSVLPFRALAERHLGSVHSIASGHDVMSIHPQMLAVVIAEVCTMLLTAEQQRLGKVNHPSLPNRCWP